MINLSNYEDWFLLYADGELTVAEQEAVLQFVEAHPGLKEELDLLMSMKFQPETEIKLNDTSTIKAEYFSELETKYSFEPDLNIQFPDKQSLYKRTATPVISIFRYAAVAASTILTAGLIWWFSGNASVEQSVAQTEVKAETKTIAPLIESVDEEAALQKYTTSEINATAVIKRQPLPTKNKVQLVSNVVTQFENDLQAVEASPQILAPAYVDRPRSNFTQEAMSAAEARMISEPSLSIAAKATPAINTSMIIDAEMNSEKQVPARGLLRKISRTLLGEENEEVDGKKYVQFAVFQIPVKQ
ncbi:MAG: hypothetical protein ACK492_02630 [Chitinophagaceae bacterium]|jgi:hypothetical protein